MGESTVAGHEYISEETGELYTRSLNGLRSHVPVPIQRV
jgi:hypothetical protein